MSIEGLNKRGQESKGGEIDRNEQTRWEMNEDDYHGDLRKKGKRWAIEADRRQRKREEFEKFLKERDKNK